MENYRDRDMNLTGQGVYQRETRDDKKFLAWLKTLPCCVCGAYPPSDPAHVRLGGRSIMGGKPKFSAVPCCRKCHQKQHQHGHLSIMPTELWLELADKYRERFFALGENNA